MLDERSQGQQPDEIDSTLDEATETPDAGTTQENSQDDVTTELEQLRKSLRHGTQKITQQGMENSDLRREIDTLKRELQTMRSQPARSADYYENEEVGDYEYVPPNGQNRRNSGQGDDIDLFKQAVREIAQEHLAMKREREQTTQQQTLMNEFGVTAQDAEDALTLFSQGKIVEGNKLLTLAGRENQARTTRQQEREAQRRLAGTSAATGISSENAAGSNAGNVMENLDKMDNWQARINAVADQVTNDPKFLDKLSKIKR